VPVPLLKPGDKIRLVSPASTPDRDEVSAIAAKLMTWGLRVDYGQYVFNKLGYLAGTDAERLADLNAAFRDEEVRAVFATRGGKGAYRIADQLDFDALRRDPKPLVGFSDITNLHLAIYGRTGVSGVHGAILGSNGSTNEQSLRDALMGQDDIVIVARAEEITAGATRPGVTHGRLLGGNLDAVATAAGWTLPSLKGAILLLEAVNMGIGQVDRQLTMLRKAGHLSGVVGVALGQFTGFDIGGTYNIIDVLKGHLHALDVPILGGLPLGHGDDPQSVVVGAQATLEAETDRLVIHRNPAVR
jgi:muramoyltetrapeptide carboxypeptidase